MQHRSSLTPRSSVIFTLELPRKNSEIQISPDKTAEKPKENNKSQEDEKSKDDIDKEKPKEKAPEKIPFKLNSPYLKEVCLLLGYNLEDLKKKSDIFTFSSLINNFFYRSLEFFREKYDKLSSELLQIKYNLYLKRHSSNDIFLIYMKYRLILKK